MPSTPRPDQTDSYLSHLADRMAQNPAFMGYILSHYQQQEHLDTQALAEHLGTTTETLARLALCKVPAAESDAFADQVRQIAAYTGIDAILIASIAEQIHSLDRLKEQPTPTECKGIEAQSLSLGRRTLSAARDRSEAYTDRVSAPEDNLPEGDSQCENG